MEWRLAQKPTELCTAQTGGISGQAIALWASFFQNCSASQGNRALLRWQGQSCNANPTDIVAVLCATLHILQSLQSLFGWRCPWSHPIHQAWRLWNKCLDFRKKREYYLPDLPYCSAPCAWEWCHLEASPWKKPAGSTRKLPQAQSIWHLTFDPCIGVVEAVHEGQARTGLFGKGYSKPAAKSHRDIVQTPSLGTMKPSKRE